MFRVFCCRTRRGSRAEADEVTDSLEKCLSVERGVAGLRGFLERNGLREEGAALAFALRCQRVLTEISRVSPRTRAAGLPGRVRGDVAGLLELAEEVNFDLDQMNSLRGLLSGDTEATVQTLQAAQGWAVDLLQDIYKTFRKEALRGV